MSLSETGTTVFPIGRMAAYEVDFTRICRNLVEEGHILRLDRAGIRQVPGGMTADLRVVGPRVCVPGQPKTAVITYPVVLKGKTKEIRHDLQDLLVKTMGDSKDLVTCKSTTGDPYGSLHATEGLNVSCGAAIPSKNIQPIMLIQLPVAYAPACDRAAPYMNWSSALFGVFILRSHASIHETSHIITLIPLDFADGKFSMGSDNYSGRLQARIQALVCDNLMVGSKAPLEVGTYESTTIPYVKLDSIHVLDEIKESFHETLISSASKPSLPASMPTGTTDTHVSSTMANSISSYIQRLIEAKKDHRKYARIIKAREKQSLDMAAGEKEKETQLAEEIKFIRSKLKAMAKKAQAQATPVVEPNPTMSVLEQYLNAHGIKVLDIQYSTREIDNTSLDLLGTPIVSEKRLLKIIKPACETLNQILRSSAMQIRSLAISIENPSKVYVYRKGAKVAQVQEDKEVSSCFIYFKFGSAKDKPLMKLLPTADATRAYVKLQSYGDPECWPSPDLSLPTQLAVYLHPHSAPMVSTAAKLVKGLNVKQMLIPAGCLGEVQGTIAKTAVDGDLLGLISSVYQWYISANEDDAWGKNWEAFGPPC